MHLHFLCYFECPYDTNGTVSGNTENMLFTRATMSPSQRSEKQNYLSIHFYESFFLFKLCYQSEIKELLIACVFKFGLEMLSKLDYLK